MKMLSCCVFGFALATGTACFGQIDIYQSDAYSVEEMCAREAEQTPADYTGAYDSCIEKNQDKPMYQPDRNGGTEQSSENGSTNSSENSSDNSPENNSVNGSSDGTSQAETYNQNESEQDFSQDQVNY